MHHPRTLVRHGRHVAAAVVLALATLVTIAAPADASYFHEAACGTSTVRITHRETAHGGETGGFWINTPTYDVDDVDVYRRMSSPYYPYGDTSHFGYWTDGEISGPNGGAFSLLPESGGWTYQHQTNGPNYWDVFYSFTLTFSNGSTCTTGYF